MKRKYVRKINFYQVKESTTVFLGRRNRNTFFIQDIRISQSPIFSQILIGKDGGRGISHDPKNLS
jgi:hypothetical protein